MIGVADILYKIEVEDDKGEKETPVVQKPIHHEKSVFFCSDGGPPGNMGEVTEN